MRTQNVNIRQRYSGTLEVARQLETDIQRLEPVTSPIIMSIEYNNRCLLADRQLGSTYQKKLLTNRPVDQKSL